MAELEYKPFTPAQRAELQETLKKAAAPVWPTTSKVISQGETPTHEAIDVAGNLGDPVYSPLAGKVTDVRNNPDGYGVNVRILLESGQEVILAHLNGVNVQPGQEVRRGQLVGALGDTGQGGPHLHIEIREPGPDRFVKGFTSTTTALDPSDFFGRSPEFTSGSAPMSVNWSVPTGSKQVEMPAPEKWTPESIRAAAIYPVLMPLLFSGQDPKPLIEESEGTADEPDEPEGITIVNAGILGDIKLKTEPLMRIGAVGLGLVLVVVAIGALVKEPIKKGIGVAKKVAPAVIGAANPAAGVVAGVAAS